MKNRSSLLSEFNFWPAFTDLMLSFILILFIFLIVSYIVFSSIVLNPTVRDNQNSFIGAVAKEYKKTFNTTAKDTVYAIQIDKDPNHNVIFVNEQHIQRIRFSANILFEQDSYTLQPDGTVLLKQIGKLLLQNISNIREIQIQGHADNVKTIKFKSNVELASLRAIEVFNFLKDKVGINPVDHLMSATSFGEYKPVSRSEDDIDYNEVKLAAANTSRYVRDVNRRIELLLFYQIPK